MPLAYVVPMRDIADDADPWQLLDAGQAVAIERVERVARRAGVSYPATSSVARALQPLLGLFESTGSNLYRVHLPTGSSLNDLVPAVGGGYRGVVRSGGKGISGHARLVPATLNAAKVARVSIVGVAIAADYLAQQELAVKLAAIERGVNHLVERFDAEDRATLEVAAETIAEAQAAIAGETSPPKSLGLDATASKLKHLLARERAWVQQLATAGEHIADAVTRGKFDGDGVPIDVFEGLVDMEGLHEKPWRYVERVANYYRALVLDSHLAVLAIAEAELSSDAPDLEEFTTTLGRRLRVNALRQEQLVSATEALAREPITSRFLQRKLKEAHAVERAVTAVAFGVRASVQLPEFVNARGRQELELEVLESGEIKLLTPAR